MRIGGFNKFSLIDYPGKTCAIIFTQGCNFRCPFCHNPELVLPEQFAEPIPFSEIEDFLKKRKGLLDAVEITGGEPTVQKDLLDVVKQIRKLGYLIKVDTNGSNPEVVEKAINENLVDYFAMDVKAPLEDYSPVAGVEVDTEKIRESIKLIMQYAHDYEFRTTAIRRFHTKESFEKIAMLIKGARRYYIQNAHYDKTVSKEFQNEKVFFKEEIRAFCKEVEPYVEHCISRI